MPEELLSKESLAKALEAETKLREDAEQSRAAAERARDAGESAAVRIANIILEAEADKTIPHSKHCGEAIVLARIRSVLHSEHRL